MTNPLARQVDLLLSGRGFNYYQAENRARADDLLIREQSAQSLSQAVNALSALHGAYRLRYLPPPSRDTPFPPPEEKQRAQDIISLRDQISRLATIIRGMSAPTQDKIWKQLRQEIDILNQLVTCDMLLISTCEAIRASAEALTPQKWRPDDARAEIEDQLRELEAVIRDRQRILQMV